MKFLEEEMRWFGVRPERMQAMRDLVARSIDPARSLEQMIDALRTWTAGGPTEEAFLAGFLFGDINGVVKAQRTPMLALAETAKCFALGRKLRGEEPHRGDEQWTQG